jgi:DNA invertase Pin-like site-specific DNA recombinase
MIMNILATLAQWERDIISERTRDSMQFMRNSLKLVGAVPFGFDLAGKEITPNPDEMKAAMKLIVMKEEGASYQKIAGQLNADDVPSKNGGKWHPKTVMGVVRYFNSLPGDHWVIKQYFPEGVNINVGKGR